MFRSSLALLIISLSLVSALPTQTWHADLLSQPGPTLREYLGGVAFPEASTTNGTLSESSHDVAQGLDLDRDTLQDYFDSVLLPRNEAHLNGDINNHTHHLMRRGCIFNKDTFKWDCDDNIPTMSEMVSWLREKPGGTATRDRMAAFYVNLHDVDPALRKGADNDGAKLVAWCNKNNLKGKYYWWANACDYHWIEAQVDHLEKNRERIEKAHPEWKNPKQIFLHGLFQAMAFAAQQPDVLFFTQAGKDWDKKTIWQEVEFPTLTRNRKVQRIMRIDPTCADNKPEVMWDRKRRDPLPPVVFVYPDMR